MNRAFTPPGGRCADLPKDQVAWRQLSTAVISEKRFLNGTQEDCEQQHVCNMRILNLVMGSLTLAFVTGRG